MHWIDIVIAVPLFWGFYKGITKGFIIEACSLASLFLSVYLGMRFSNYLAEAAAGKFSIDFKYLPLIMFILIFILVLIGMYFFAKALDNTVRTASLGGINKLCGAFFGICKFGLIVSVILFIVNAVDEKTEIVSAEIKTQSLLYSPLSRFALVAIPAIKESEALKEIKETYTGKEIKN